MKLIELFESSSDILSYFDQHFINDNKQQKWKARNKLVMMPIDMFLSLAKPGYDPEKEQRVLEMIKNKIPLTVPYLYIDYNDSQARTVGHEGRHRARAMKKLGYTHIPVDIRTDKIRWSEQDDPNLFDYIKNWPTTLTSETNSTTIKFPIPRESANKDFLTIR